MDFKLSQKQLIAIFIIAFIPVIFLSVREALVNPEVDIWESWEWPKTFVSLMFSLLVTLLLFAGNTYIIRYLNIRMPWGEYLVKRIITEAALCMVYSGLAMVLLYTLLAKLTPYASLGKVPLFWNVFIAIVITIVAVLIVEGIDFFRRWTQTQVEAEKLQRENLQARYDVLRNQIRPHFLFNSLNVLSSLVHKDPDQAEDFIEQLSEVYRYVLDTGENTLVTVQKDLKALEAYIFLQQTRYGQNLKFNQELDENALNGYIPPLTFQILMENAVKHNVIGKEAPLTVTLKRANPQYMVMENNIRERTDKNPSTGIGLKNLKERFSFVTDLQPEFHSQDNRFLAYIPLIQKT